jgi:hypothetical protein
MTSKEFVQAIRVYVINKTVQHISEDLASPPLKGSSQESISASLWFQKLDDESRRHVFHVMRESAESVAFGLFCVIDGVRVIEAEEEKCDFRLTSISPEGIETILNSSEGEMLHDLLNAQ